MTRRGLLFLLLLSVAPAAAGTTVYKCTGHDGKVSYQGMPCSAMQRQKTLTLRDRQPTPAPAPAAPVADTPAPAIAAPPPPPSRPAAPLPLMYRCVRATDGTTYLSSGQPAPYLAPLGMLGIVPTSLAQTYSGANHMGHGKVTAGLVANNYTWVQDRCRELSPSETCQALHDDWDANEDKLRRAFKSDQPPLLKREAELRAQLTNC
ncbi:DUF4124 domain-containing protein [Rhodanobacter glycinis]|jgi:hypothetical protein|uniref:DUF4124 domain-containing protein n=1 Tax=Rhodanobacter glycinis TaxID=582702 RepID=A0A1I4AM39_9GAMM|nr:DUF4124 domain-containing protein [Rhodanobacter glycinis]SFK57565.1 protein of unknown function [Rhodanobacter glycinis]